MNDFFIFIHPSIHPLSLLSCLPSYPSLRIYNERNSCMMFTCISNRATRPWGLDCFEVAGFGRFLKYLGFFISMHHFYKNKVSSLKREGDLASEFPLTFGVSLLLTHPSSLPIPRAKAFKLIQYPWWPYPSPLHPEITSGVLSGRKSL